MILLKSLKTEVIKTTFFDPQYRGILDKLKYDNEGVKRGQARHNLTQTSEDVIRQFIHEINRVLVPSGHLFL